MSTVKRNNLSSAQQKRRPPSAVVKYRKDMTPQKTAVRKSVEKATPSPNKGTDLANKTCVCGHHTKIDVVVYRYPRGLASSYTLDFRAKDIQKPIPFFNYNTHQPQKYEHKMDLSTTKQVFSTNTKT